MKISMSSEQGDLKVSVSAQLQHEGFEHGALVPLLAAKGGYSEGEALNDLQELLQNTMPEALLQADSTLRIAIEERLLSISRDAHPSQKNSLSDSGKKGQAFARLTEIIVVYGPPGCGKTTNSERLKSHFKADSVVEGDCRNRDLVSGWRTLILWNDSINSAIEAFQLDDPQGSQRIDSIRFISFTAAMQELH